MALIQTPLLTCLLNQAFGNLQEDVFEAFLVGVDLRDREALTD